MRTSISVKQLTVFIAPFILASFYTISIHQTTFNSSVVDNGIKYEHTTFPAHGIITTNSTQQHKDNYNIPMTDLDHDYTTDDYRAFLFGQHPIHGLLLLYCSRKKKKSPHFQAPGGHVDKEDFEAALTRLQNTDTNTIASQNSSHPLLVLACKIGAARELYEETGVDLRDDLDRLQPVQLRKSQKDGSYTSSCVLKHRVFFKICFTDNDFVTEGFDSKVALGLSQSMNTEPPMLMIKLSQEHQGFVFEPNSRRAVDLLIQHSGGKVSAALDMAIGQGEIKSIEPSELDESHKVVGNPMVKEAKDHTETEKGVKGVFDCFDCC